MWEQRVGCLPVIDDARRPLGVITDRDVCMGAYTQGRRLDDITVAVAMSRPARTCSVTATVEAAERLMREHALRRVVVVDHGGQVCGLLSLDDIAREAVAFHGAGGIDLGRASATLGEIARRQRSQDAEGGEASTTSLETFLENSVAALATLRDEIHRDVALAGKAARASWTRLEARLQAAEGRTREAPREAARKVAAALRSAMKFRQRLHTERRPHEEART
jgi:CBS-domain-containing membrane protein